MDASVAYLVPPRVDGSLIYQRYYLIGLDAVARLSLRGAPWRAVLARDVSGKIDRIVPPRPIRLARRLTRAAQGEADISRYELRTHDGTWSFIIDATDNHGIRHPHQVDEVDVYFKANRWSEVGYPDRVVPIVNGNGFVTPRRIEELRRLRDVPKSVDVAFITNVWSGRPHDVRILERLARSGCSSDLLAVFPAFGRLEDEMVAQRRLEAAGVRVVRDPVPLSDLWRRLARARVVVIRYGRHSCIPWRMIDLLGMGACILFDAIPHPQWPVPLQEDVHYASMALERPEWEPVDEDEYDKVVPALERLLGDPETRASLSRQAADYFEHHARPEAVGRYVLETVLAEAPRSAAANADERIR